jgi:hypothetical protein
MPMRYANEADVLEQLQDMSGIDPEHAGLVRLENALCDVFDHKVGTSFGTTPVAETRTVAVGLMESYVYPFPGLGGVPLVDYRNGFNSPRLVLSVPLRSLTSIVTGGEWDGSAWVDGETLATSDYILTNRTEQGYYGIDRINGTWAGSIRITGIWGDQVTATVPDDVSQVLTELTVKEWHRRHASPAGEIGPSGLTITPGNPWNLEYVKAVIDKYRVVEVLV